MIYIDVTTTETQKVPCVLNELFMTYEYKVLVKACTPMHALIHLFSLSVITTSHTLLAHSCSATVTA